ncbi:MAG: 16S rRNA (uracil(1498)-N(3))-methyltransferase [Actinomycetes bacterium]
MTAPVFLAPRERLGHDVVVLDGAEGRHAAVVRRVQVGEAVTLVDGAGLCVEGSVTEVHRDRVLVAAHARRTDPEPTPRLVVVQALAKGDRGERAVEAMTEVGVDEIVPWAASRSIAKWRDSKPLEKWRTTAREAAKQSRRSWFPTVTDAADTNAVAARLSTAGLAAVCHESAEESLADVAVPNVGEVVLVIGPEGSITDDELAAFTAAGGPPYRMGPTVLRTSTAGVVAASILLSKTPRWRS